MEKPRRWSSSHPGPTREMREVVEASEYDKLADKVTLLKADVEFYKNAFDQMDEAAWDLDHKYQDLKTAADRLADAWDKHQASKFKSDGSHFQADLELNVALQDYRARFPKETT